MCEPIHKYYFLSACLVIDFTLLFLIFLQEVLPKLAPPIWVSYLLTAASRQSSLWINKADMYLKRVRFKRNQRRIRKSRWLAPTKSRTKAYKGLTATLRLAIGIAAMVSQFRSKQAEIHSSSGQLPMDADAREMRLDPGATHCISYDCKDFVGKLVRTTGVIQGYHSGTKAKAKPLLLGTMRIKIEDDNETIYSFDVPDSILDPGGTTRIFCPQHWAQACSKAQRPHMETDPSCVGKIKRQRMSAKRQ